MEIIRKAGNNMDDTNRKEQEQDRVSVPEIEGDRWGWFYVCSDFHGLIDWKDQVCPHCKARIDWNG